jgi:uncharacterized protein YecT (DUF1311 family)
MPKYCSVVLFSLSLLIGLPSHAQHMNEPDSPCAQVVVTSYLADCLSKARVSSDAELNALYQKIRARLNANAARQLTDTQRLWIQYRDANYAAERSLYEGGTASYPVYVGCLEAMTRARTKELYGTYAVRLK